MSKKVPDLTGATFGRWKVLQYAGRDKDGRIQYKCQCSCGTVKVIRRNSLTSGNSKSCGCLSADVARTNGTTHGCTGTRLYRIWAGIIQRCCNPNAGYEFQNYGARGIAVCEDWKRSFEKFRNWAIEAGYENDLSIDRINVNGDYCPENCRWATVYEQNNNKRTSKLLTYNGKTATVREFADKYGLAYSCLYARIKSGWDVETALLTPSKRGGTP